MKKRYKIIVAVDVLCPVEGDMVPTAITWEDGTIYLIDRVLDVRRAASLKAGGQGMRYTVRIRGKERYLWYDLGDKPHWFVEAND